MLCHRLTMCCCRRALQSALVAAPCASLPPPPPHTTCTPLAMSQPHFPCSACARVIVLLSNQASRPCAVTHWQASSRILPMQSGAEPDSLTLVVCVGTAPCKARVFPCTQRQVAMRTHFFCAPSSDGLLQQRVPVHSTFFHPSPWRQRKQRAHCRRMGLFFESCQPCAPRYRRSKRTIDDGLRIFIAGAP